MLLAISNLGNSQCWKFVSTGISNCMAIRNDGSLWVWGFNEAGQLGDGTQNSKNFPQKLSESNWIKIAPGGYHTIAIKSDSTLWAWGKNNYGQLGDGSTNEKLYPIQIGTDKDWSQISTGFNHSIALKSNGSLWGWGRNTHFQAGGFGVDSVFLPTQIGVETDWIQIASGYNHNLVLKSDHTLWSWGDNFGGQLGIGIISRSVPLSQEITFSTDWKSISGGQYHSLAIKNDGTLWAWGNNSDGKLGDKTYISKLIPTIISDDTTWNQIAAGIWHSMALKNNGTLWAWGWNNLGQFGDSTFTDSNIPIQIGNNGDWSSISVRDYHSFGLKSNGTIFTWGNNYYGQLGNGTTITNNIPTEIFTIKLDSILGNTVICQGSTVTYFVENNADSITYIWTLPNGWIGNSKTNFITVKVDSNSGNISVIGLNSCSSSIPITQFINVSKNKMFLQNIDLCAGESITIGKNTYSQSGIYSDTLKDSNICDSILITNLNINSEIDVSIGVNAHKITANKNGAMYMWTNCDLNYMPIPNETNQSFIATKDGNYAVIIKEGSCSDTSDCVNIIITDIKNENQILNVEIHPNPSQDFITISNSQLIKKITVTDFKQSNIDINFNEKIIDISHLGNGIYFFTLEFFNGNKQIEKVIIIK